MKKQKSQYENLIEQLKEAKAEYKRVFFNGTREEIDAAVKRIHELEDSLKAIDKAIGRRTGTGGNYKSAIEDA